MRAVRLGLLAVFLFTPHVSAQSISPRILVMPFEDVAREGRIFWMSEASAVLLADAVNRLGGNAITREERREAFARLQVPLTAALTDATVIRIGQVVGAAEVVVGSLTLDGEILAVTAKSIALEPGRVRSTVTERGPLPELFAMFDRIARRLMGQPVAAESAGTGSYPPIAAFENYIKGIVAEKSVTAVGYLNSALQVDPGFDRARLALWEVYEDEGDHDRALAAALSVPAGSPVLRRARFLAGLSQIQLKKYDDAFATFKALADERRSGPVMNNLGVIQLNRGTTPQGGIPAYWFNQAAQLDPNEPDFFFNLGYAYWFAKDVQAAIYWLREAVRRNPADGDAHFVLSAALEAGANPAESSRELELARRLSSAYEEAAKRPDSDPVPRGLERVKNDVELPRASRIESAVESAGQRDQQVQAQFYLDRAHRLFEQANNRDALADIRRALFLSPYLSDAHLLAGRIHLRDGRVPEAIDALKISLWSAETAEAHLVLGEAFLAARDVDAARTEARRALSVTPSFAAAAELLKRIDAGSSPTP